MIALGGWDDPATVQAFITQLGALVAAITALIVALRVLVQMVRGQAAQQEQHEEVIRNLKALNGRVMKVPAPYLSGTSPQVPEGGESLTGPPPSN